MTIMRSQSKVPAVTAWFWAMKICATTLGETASDHLAHTLEWGYAATALVVGAVLALTLALQLRAEGHHPWRFWPVMLTTSIAGTAVSDYMDRTLGLGYAAGSLILVDLLAGILLVWRSGGGVLAVSEIRSRRDESLYWAAILVSNTLGTALGDFLADDSGLGFGGGAALIAGLLAVVLALHRTGWAPVVALFWAAFILTRPLGATVGDLLTKTHAQGGLELGTLGATAVLTAFLVGSILWTGGRGRSAQGGGN